MASITSKIIFLIFFFSFATFANSQFIVLSCKKTLTRNFLEEYPKFNAEMCTKIGGVMCDEARRTNNNVLRCVQSGLNYSHKREYTIDRKSLDDRSQSFVDLVNENCWGENSNTRNRMTTSASTLFIEDSETSFNIDRATLRGGWREDRSWTCDAKEIALKNKI